jgi:hypothetical protein
MSDATNGSSKWNSARVDASSAAIARKIRRLPPGEHLVELQAKALPDQRVLRVAALSRELQAGTVANFDRIFDQPPSSNNARGARAFTAQGAFWLSLLAGCGLKESELQDITLVELAEKISGKQVIAVINDSGFWNRARPI